MIRLGQRLREKRIKKGLSLDDVTKEIKIRPTFLSAIECGEYGKLPETAYAQGFVANYADYLGFSRGEALALFRREFDEASIISLLPKRFAEPADTVLSKIKFQRNTIWIVSIFAAVLFFLGYSYKDALLNPPLRVTGIKENIVYTGEIKVQGKTSPYASVTVNSLPVYVSQDGSFTKTITTFPGKIKVIIKAVNRFGKSSVIEKVLTVRG